MKVSIVTVVYNGEKFIKRCIESVLSQKNVDFEYIIIDGASNDKTLSYIKSYKDKRIQLISEKDNGMYDALNKGLSLVTGDIVCYINYDDYFSYNSVFYDYVNVFLNNNLVDVVYSNANYVDEGNNILMVKEPLKYKERYVLTLGMFYIQPTFFFRRGLLDKVGFFNLDYKVASDYDLFSRLLINSRKVHKLEKNTVGFLWDYESFGAKNAIKAKEEVVYIKNTLKEKIKFNKVFYIIDRIYQKHKKVIKNV
ncbi:TPA: glycosyltransferase family 2 protein [Photobacterium damselae]